MLETRKAILNVKMLHEIEWDPRKTSKVRGKKSFCHVLLCTLLVRWEKLFHESGWRLWCISCFVTAKERWDAYTIHKMMFTSYTIIFLWMTMFQINRDNLLKAMNFLHYYSHTRYSYLVCWNIQYFTNTIYGE